MLELFPATFVFGDKPAVLVVLSIIVRVDMKRAVVVMTRGIFPKPIQDAEQSLVVQLIPCVYSVAV